MRRVYPYLVLLWAGCTSTVSVGDGGVLDASTPDLLVQPPSISSWMGTNVAADLPRVDITYQLAPFDSTNNDANGYPLTTGTSSTDIGFILTSGDYKVSYKGTGTLTISGIGKTDPWQAVNGEQRSTIHIVGTPGNYGNFLTLTVANTAGQTVSDIHIYYPGYDWDTTTVFLPEFIRILKPFRALRFMDWESTNNNAIVDWKDRPASAHYGQSAFGQPYEHIVALANQTGKDIWITVPEHASDDFIQQLATFFATGLDFAAIDGARAAAGFTTPFEVLVEDSNETWNPSFSAKATFLAAANADVRFDGVYHGTYGPSWQSSDHNLMKVGQYHADRLVEIGTAFRKAFAAVGHGDQIAPVLSGWTIGTAYTDVGLQFINAEYGDPKAYVSYIALAPYFAPADADTTSLDALFTAMDANIDSTAAFLADFHKLGAQYGIAVAGYEGGQSITGNANLPIKHLAQHDARMYASYQRFNTLWKKNFGPSLFMHFSLADDPGRPEFNYQYGFWGSIISTLEDPAVCSPNLPTLTGTETVASVVHHCPKYRALAETVPN